MSMPTSAMASTTAGLRCSAGSVPAECTTTRPWAWRTMRAAAIWDRPALCTHKNRTSGRFSVIEPSVSCRFVVVEENVPGVVAHLRIEHGDTGRADRAAHELEPDETRHRSRRDPGEGVRQHAGERHG